MSDERPRMGSDEWCTPKHIADALGEFDLDPCSNRRSHVIAARCLGPEWDDTDGLMIDWEEDSVFLNWPYSNPLPWARKVAMHSGPWVVLAKLDPTTRWWAELMRAAPTVAPFRKRIRFEGAPGEPTMTANFPSVLVYSAWRPSHELAAMLWLPTYAQGAA